MACLLTVLAPLAASQELKAADKPPVAENLEMAEDVEVMGEVLRRAMIEVYTPRVLAVLRGSDPNCSRCHTGPSHGVSDHGMSSLLDGVQERGLSRLFKPVEVNRPIHEDLRDPWCHISGAEKATVERPLGAYLEGYGIVYQVRLDVSLPGQQQPEDTADNGKGDSGAGRPWDNALRALSGRPPLLPNPVEAEPVLPTKNDLAERLLDVLTENVGNLRRLKPQDRLTVAITFRGSEGKCSATSRDAEGAVGVDKALHDFDEFFPLTPHGNASLVRGSHEVSGDLHMRQQNYQKAIEGYRNAIEALGDSKPRSALVLKLIQAYVALGDLERAEQLIKETRVIKPRSENEHATHATSAAIPLPAKLIVSATKSQLSDAAAGKMTREDLNKQATVQYFNLRPSTNHVIPGHPPGKVVPNTHMPRF